MEAISDLLAYIWSGITYFFTVIIPAYYDVFSSFFSYISNSISYFFTQTIPSFWDSFKTFYLSVSGSFLHLFSLLSIANVLRSVLPYVSGMLPLPNYPWGPLILRANDAFLYIAPYVSMLDYFVDLTVYIAVLLTISLLEFALLGFRVWRTIRSLVT